ncbi:MAG TPA: flagellar biosynthesis repressor FlbT [Sphingomonas sp.]|nr:flagellar biosynthesis repressor FlbT [Sphingomonas sp.]
MLRITLRDGEKVVVNGAVLSAVGRTTLLVENKATILRGREVMTPEEATTPARQLYFHTIMAYMDEENREEHQDRIVESLRKVAALLPDQEALAATVAFASKAAHLQFYKALADCRQLMRLEAEALDQLDAAA